MHLHALAGLRVVQTRVHFLKFPIFYIFPAHRRGIDLSQLPLYFPRPVQPYTFAGGAPALQFIARQPEPGMAAKRFRSFNIASFRGFLGNGKGINIGVVIRVQTENITAVPVYGTDSREHRIALVQPVGPSSTGTAAGR